MSKDAKISFAQTIGVMIITGILMFCSFVSGFVCGMSYDENNKTEE